MGLYKFKTVPVTEKDKLLKFIDEHWKKGHAIVKSDELLKFQHYNVSNDSFNFIVAENEETGEYDALVGYIPVAQYDESLVENGNYWGAIWKRRDDIQNSEINNAAFFVWKRLFKLPFFQSYAAIGISEMAKQIYIASRMNMGYLSHYYILNDKIKDYRIADNVTKNFLKPTSILSNESCFAKWVNIDDVPMDLKPYYKPLKSLDYFKKRYDSHPIYKYRFIGIYDQGLFVTLLACRIIEANGSKCIRIMDVLGQLYGNFYDSLKELIYLEGAEYIDIMNYGIDKDIFLQTGFNELDIDGELIIPNYFEPFEQRNVKIELAYKANYDRYVAFKGDSDQDRPNIL